MLTPGPAERLALRATPHFPALPWVGGGLASMSSNYGFSQRKAKLEVLKDSFLTWRV